MNIVLRVKLPIDLQQIMKIFDRSAELQLVKWFEREKALVRTTVRIALSTIGPA